MRKVLLFLVIISISLTFECCSKSYSNNSLNSIEKEYKSLTSDNVNRFFLESSLANRGCAGANCTSNFRFNFKNLNYATDISLYVGNYQPTSIWSFYTSDKEVVSTFSRDYSVNQYKLRYTLKDGRVLITNWISF